MLPTECRHRAPTVGRRRDGRSRAPLRLLARMPVATASSASAKAPGLQSSATTSIARTPRSTTHQPNSIDWSLGSRRIGASADRTTPRPRQANCSRDVLRSPARSVDLGVRRALAIKVGQQRQPAAPGSDRRQSVQLGVIDATVERRRRSAVAFGVHERRNDPLASRISDCAARIRRRAMHTACSARCSQRQNGDSRLQARRRSSHVVAGSQPARHSTRRRPPWDRPPVHHLRPVEVFVDDRRCPPASLSTPTSGSTGCIARSVPGCGEMERHPVVRGTAWSSRPSCRTRCDAAASTGDRNAGARADQRQSVTHSGSCFSSSRHQVPSGVVPQLGGRPPRSESSTTIPCCWPPTLIARPLAISRSHAVSNARPGPGSARIVVASLLDGSRATRQPPRCRVAHSTRCSAWTNRRLRQDHSHGSVTATIRTASGICEP